MQSVSGSDFVCKPRCVDRRNGNFRDTHLSAFSFLDPYPPKVGDNTCQRGFK